MKKLLPFIFLLIPLTLKAESASVGGNFRGLNNGDSSILIADNEAQDLLNVDLTKNAYGVSKRAGYDDFKTIGTSTWGVRGGYYFTDQSGNNKIIHANGTGVFYSLNGGAYTGFYTTATAGSYWDFVDSQGILYGANHNHDPPFTYNGTALTFSTSVPAGSQVEAYPDRLVVAGSTANPNNIYFSRAANFSDFTVGDLGDDAPYFEYYGLPGQLVQAIKYALGELLIWTKTSMGRYVGSNQFDGTIDDISSTIGSDQPSTVVTDLGVTYFQATDRHFYAYDGQSIAKISDAISGSVDGFVTGESRDWETTSQSDFSSGSFGSGVSSTTSPGDAVYVMEAEQTSGNATFGVTASTVYYAQSFRTSPGFILSYARIHFQSVTGTLGSTWTIRTDSSGSPSAVCLATAVVSLSNSDLSPEVSFASPVSLSADTTYWLYIDIPLGTHAIYSSMDDSYTNGKVIVNGTEYAFRDLKFHVGSTSSTYTNGPFNIGTNITSWGPVYFNNVLDDGNISYGIYTDSNTVISISDSSSWISSQTVTNGTIPSFATAAYVTWRAVFTRTSQAQTPTINDLTISWYEGALTRNWGTADKDHRILWSVAEGTATVPNSTYIYDPRYQSWLKYSVPFDAPAKVGNSIYFGGVSTGVVYQWPTGNTDNGSAINAFWKSKDFIAPDPYVEKDFLSASIIAKTQTGSNLDVIYTINTSSSITKNFSLTDSNGLSLKRINFSLPSGKYGTFINFRFGNDDSDAPFEFYSFKYDYKPRPWRQIQ